MICKKPKTPMVKNHASITGPKEVPTTLVPNCWKKNNSKIMPVTIPIINQQPGINEDAKAGTLLSPSIAEATDIGGVMIPSANKVPAPMMAGIASHLP